MTEQTQLASRIQELDNEIQSTKADLKLLREQRADLADRLLQSCLVGGDQELLDMGETE